jgi:hypothetical protein
MSDIGQFLLGVLLSVVAMFAVVGVITVVQMVRIYMESEYTRDKK